MGVNPVIRLIKLDFSLLLNMGANALKHAGALYASPLLITMVIFMAVSLISNCTRLFMHRDHNSNLRPWMVKYQFIFAYSEKKPKKGLTGYFSRV